MVNFEQYLLRSRSKRLPKTCLFFMYVSFGLRKKFTANTGLSYKYSILCKVKRLYQYNNHLYDMKAKQLNNLIFELIVI